MSNTDAVSLAEKSDDRSADSPLGKLSPLLINIFVSIEASIQHQLFRHLGF